MVCFTVVELVRGFGVVAALEGDCFTVVVVLVVDFNVSLQQEEYMSS